MNPTELTGRGATAGKENTEKLKNSPITVQSKILKKQEQRSFHLVAGIVS